MGRGWKTNPQNFFTDHGPRLLKILILKPSSLGDVVQALPVLRLIKRRHPASEIYWWIETSLAPLLEGDPDLAGVIPFDRKRWASPPHWPALWRNLRWLRAQQFDWVIDLQSLARSGAFAWLANGKFLIGLDDAREGARGYYDVIVPRASRLTHAVDWYLSVLPPLGVPVEKDFDWLPSRPAVAASLGEKWGAQWDGTRWILFHPGARWDNKCWPVERFAELARELSRDGSVRLAVLGGAADRALGAAITAAAPGACLDLTGQTTLPEMIEWVRLGELLITNDTGPMHVAAALGRPVVGIFGPTEPARTGPYGQTKSALQSLHLPCVPCLKSHCAYEKPMECLRAITPERVLAEVRRRLVVPAPE